MSDFYRTTWRKEISTCMSANGDSWDDVIKITLEKDGSLDTEFYCGIGEENGCYFTVWTAGYVYFPASYDGSEWCASVPRHPCEVATVHIGGG